MVGFLAKAFLQKNPGAKIIYDPRLIWNTIEICEENGGEAVVLESHKNWVGNDPVRSLERSALWLNERV